MPVLPSWIHLASPCTLSYPLSSLSLAPFVRIGNVTSTVSALGNASNCSSPSRSWSKAHWIEPSRPSRVVRAQVMRLCCGSARSGPRKVQVHPAPSTSRETGSSGEAAEARAGEAANMLRHELSIGGWDDWAE